MKERFYRRRMSVGLHAFELAGSRIELEAYAELILVDCAHFAGESDVQSLK